MKLAVSNIAWPVDQDEAVAELLGQRQVAGLEIAPTKIWAKPLEASEQTLAAYRQWWEARGIRIIAAQSLLFGQPELTLFQSAEARRKTLEYLGGIIRLCGLLGCESLVFGSPRNRRIEGQAPAAVEPMAVEFFSQLGEIAAGAGTCVVLEANPPQYGADYIVKAAEAIELVKAVNHPGFRLHLDTGCMTLAGDPVAETIEQGLPWLRHFHVSEPELNVVGSGSVNLAPFAAALREQHYAGWVSIEMREPTPFARHILADSIEYTTRIFA